MSNIYQRLDTSGLNCPLPILRAKKALKAMAPGQCLWVIATDPGSVEDFAAFSRQTGHALEASIEEHGNFCFLLRRS